jgi:hypothetical protein
MKKTVITFVLVSAFVIGIFSLASAARSYLTAIGSEYNTLYGVALPTQVNSCTLCHAGSPSVNNVNSFGDAYAANGYQFAGIQTSDSDGDGFSNLAEIQAGTFPGDPASKPAAPNPNPKIGVYHNGVWYLDANGNGVWDGAPTDRLYYFGGGVANGKPVTGDWNNSGTTKIGIFSNGTWYLDLNGNGAWNGTPTDAIYYFGGGIPGALPVTGDWDGSGTTNLGVYDPASGTWYLDYNGNGTWDGPTVDRMYTFHPGIAGATPITGTWAGTTATGIGVYSDGVWYLDLNGNGIWDGVPTDAMYTNYGIGLTGEVAIAADYAGTGKSQACIFLNGTWFVDYNGNGAWNGVPSDYLYHFGEGLSGAVPVSGKW